MKIDHIALWVRDLEKMKAFYEQYFNGTANAQYHNPSKGFYSYFISFEEGGRLELMQRPGIVENSTSYEQQGFGLVHLAIAVGSHQQVDQLTNQLQRDGFTVVGQPRTTGDGYYESIVLDPERNIVEITA